MKGSIAKSDLLEILSPYALFYPFNHPQTAVDADYWTVAGDAGGFTVDVDDDEPPSRKLYADTAQNNDYYIHGDVKYNRLWNPVQSPKYSKTIFEARIKLLQTDAEIVLLFGLFEAGAFPTAYAEPAVDCAHFFYDHDTVATNFVCRTYDAAAEEQTDSTVAADTNYHVFRIEWTAASVLFYIDGVLVATHDTTVPDSPMGSVALIRTENAGGAERAMDIEYIDVWVED